MTKADRMRIYEKRVQNSRDLEAEMKERVSRGLGTMEGMLRAKAARLEAEIDLLREQAAAD